jgi:hypothetical protein
MKPAPSGSRSKKKKPRYLAEAMQFAVPYIKALSMATGNLPNVPLEEDQQFRDIDTEESIAVQDSVPLSPSQPLPPPPPPPRPTPVMLQPDENFQTEQQCQPMSASCPKSKLGLNDDVDRTFVEYFQAKKARIVGTPGHNTSQNQRNEALKMFLLSMLPDLELMTDEQIRQFKRKSLQTIDNMLSQHSYPTCSPASVHSLISQSPSHSSHSSTVLLHTSRDSCDIAPETPQSSSLESSVAAPDNDSTVADDYYDAVQHALTENYKSFNPQESMQ